MAEGEETKAKALTPAALLPCHRHVDSHDVHPLACKLLHRRQMFRRGVLVLAERTRATRYVLDSQFPRVLTFSPVVMLAGVAYFGVDEHNFIIGLTIANGWVLYGYEQHKN
jgi:hypothetical protein